MKIQHFFEPQTSTLTYVVHDGRTAVVIDPVRDYDPKTVFVVAMATLIFVRETDVWLTTARAALPASVPELVFALVVLAIGIATGRISRRVGADPMADRSFSEGAGI
jgi:hypothetical protein